jgi:hypothetical protein
MSGFPKKSFLSVIATPGGGVIAIGVVAPNLYIPSPYSLVVNFAASGDVVWAKSLTRIAAVTQVPFGLVREGRLFPAVDS